MALSLVIAFAYPLIAGVLEEYYTPRDYWFTYHSVEPTKPVFSTDESLTFYSVREIRKTAEYRWHDVLVCTVNGLGERVISIYESAQVLHPHSIPAPGGVWTYNEALPDKAAECYLRSTTTAKLRYTDKVQTLESRKFYIRDIK